LDPIISEDYILWVEAIRVRQWLGDMEFGLSGHLDGERNWSPIKTRSLEIVVACFLKFWYPTRLYGITTQEGQKFYTGCYEKLRIRSDLNVSVMGVLQ
jgi:hypothetical protein